MPDCEHPLKLIYTASQDLYAGAAAADLKDCRPRDTESWEVQCEAGHVVLLPPDDAEDTHLFSAGDFDRLKEVIDMAKRKCPNCDKGKVRTITGKLVDCPHCHGRGER